MSLTELHVRAPGGEYPIVIGAGARSEIGRVLIERTAGSRFHVVTDSNVDRHHGPTLRRLLGELGRPVGETVVPAGETSKSPEGLVRLWRAILEAGCDRKSCVVAFGGGVVGDLAGFAAASALRGIQFVQVPTTLLAMVDASVGGKTGIDLPEGKNLVGAFHQPRAVVMDLDFLGTLPEREIRAGWAEVVKSAAIRDAELFARLERERDDLLGRRPDALGAVILETVRIKASVVEADEREAGLRRILNFGHTLAHGLEALSGYRGLLHGEAVSIGMVFAAELGEAAGVTAAGTSRGLRTSLERSGLPAAPPRGASAREILRVLQYDKKRGPGGIHWVLLSRIGETVVTGDIPPEVVERELERFLAPAG